MTDITDNASQSYATSEATADNPESDGVCYGMVSRNLDDKEQHRADPTLCATKVAQGGCEATGPGTSASYEAESRRESERATYAKVHVASQVGPYPPIV